MFLLDTNVWMQTLLERDTSGAIRELLATVPPRLIFITIYSAHSVGVILGRYGTVEVYRSFVRGALVESGVGIIDIPVPKLSLVVDACRAHRLDFDDAYQLSPPKFTVLSSSASTPTSTARPTAGSRPPRHCSCSRKNPNHDRNRNL